MNFKGKLTNISQNFKTQLYEITFQMLEGSINELNQIDGDVSIEVKKYHKKRSLNANEYMWVLCTKIADVLRTSKDEVYEGMLNRYGVLYQDDDGYITITVKSEVDMTKIEGHWKYYATSRDGKFKSYLMIKGTSKYDTKEMAHFIDMVVDEAKELGIETATPDELERMKTQWQSQ